MTSPPSPADFLAASPAPVGGSSPWASRYAAELRRIIYEHAAQAPRTLQQHLGPSELGSACDRQVAGKMAALPTTNHVADPWPSIVGTACHAWAADAFEAYNDRHRTMRFVAEQKVTPHPDHPGTADLYDAQEQAVVDHKFLGVTTLSKIRNDPPRRYVVQLLLYGLGYVLMGLPVKRVAIAAYPRTASSLDGLYVWDKDFSEDGSNPLPEVETLLREVFAQTTRRRAYAEQILAQKMTLRDVPAVPESDECYLCPFYRPQAARDDAGGCPGGVHMTYGG